MGEFLRPSAVRRKTALLGPKISLTDLQSPRKNGTNAETYGEPQTPVNRFTVALPSELPEFSTAANSAKRVMLQFKAASSNSIDFRPAEVWGALAAA
jgi:hypothetical protein